MSSPDLPTDWRTTMVDMVRGALPANDAWFAGGPRLSPLEQIEVYREQFRLRVGGAVKDELPGWLSMVDDPDPVVLAYLADVPSTSYTLNRITHGFPAWLADRGVGGAELDMARLDVAVIRAFEAADPVPLDPGAIAPDVVLVLQPPARLLELEHDVQHRRSAVVNNVEPLPEPKPGRQRLALFRPERRVRHLVVPEARFILLQQFEQPCAIGEALEGAVAAGVDPAELVPHLATWFREDAASKVLGPAG